MLRLRNTTDPPRVFEHFAKRIRGCSSSQVNATEQARHITQVQQH